MFTSHYSTNDVVIIRVNSFRIQRGTHPVVCIGSNHGLSYNIIHRVGYFAVKPVETPLLSYEPSHGVYLVQGMSVSVRTT